MPLVVLLLLSVVAVSWSTDDVLRAAVVSALVLSPSLLFAS
jgi:hypothetical protein